MRRTTGGSFSREKNIGNTWNNQQHDLCQITSLIFYSTWRDSDEPPETGCGGVVTSDLFSLENCGDTDRAIHSVVEQDGSQKKSNLDEFLDDFMNGSDIIEDSLLEMSLGLCDSVYLTVDFISSLLK